MAIAPHRSRTDAAPRFLRARRRRSALLGVASGVVILAAAVIVYAAVLGAAAAPAPLLAGFTARSYAPGQTARLQIDGGTASHVTLQLFLAGAAARHGAGGWDKTTFGEPMSQPQALERPAGGPWVASVPLEASWPSGDYVARLRFQGRTDYAPFILRPATPGGEPVLVIEPTNTWHAYDNLDGDSWYLDSNVHTIDLTHPFTATDIRGARVPAGLPEQFWKLDLGFLRWYWPSGFKADFFSDDDLEHIRSAAQLSRYRLIVFAGHEEYVTSHVYDLMTRYRDAGGNIAFLSANNFFYRVEVDGNTMTGRKRWRDIGRDESSLVGEHYVGWDEGEYANHPFHVVGAQDAPWLFTGTGLRDGVTFGNYGIEIDEPSGNSPADVHVLAVVPHEFGPHKPAEMTIYRHGRSTVFDAGVFNFGASAHWPAISRMVDNLWSRLSGETA